MRNLTAALVVVIGVLGGFYAGWKYSQSKLPATPAAATSQVVAGSSAATGGAGGGTGAGAAGAGGGGGAFARGVTTGQITAVGTGTITVHDRATDADVKVTFDANTPILKLAPAQVSDLASGANVSVTGPRAADGSVAAQGIQLGGPAGRGAGGG